VKTGDACPTLEIGIASPVFHRGRLVKLLAMTEGRINPTPTPNDRKCFTLTSRERVNPP